MMWPILNRLRWLLPVLVLLLLCWGSGSSWLAWWRKGDAELGHDARELKKAHAPLLRRQDPSGRQAVKAAAPSLSNSTFQDEVKSVAKLQEKRFGKRMRRLESFELLATTYRQKVMLTMAPGDSVFRSHTPYLQMVSNPLHHLPRDTLVIDLQLRDSISAFWYRDRRPHWWALWQARPHVVEVFYSNPAARADTLITARRK